MPLLLLQALFFTDRYLRRMRRVFQARTLEQPRLQIHRLAVLLTAGGYRPRLSQPDGERNTSGAGGHRRHQPGALPEG